MPSQVDFKNVLLRLWCLLVSLAHAFSTGVPVEGPFKSGQYCYLAVRISGVCSLETEGCCRHRQAFLLPANAAGATLWRRCVSAVAAQTRSIAGLACGKHARWSSLVGDRSWPSKAHRKAISSCLQRSWRNTLVGELARGEPT